MHGTYVDDVRLSKYQPKFVPDGSVLLFGTEVSRGPGKQRNQWRLDLSHFIALNDTLETFPALEIEVNYEFADDKSYERVDCTKNDPADVIMWSSCRDPSYVSRNTFSVPDYDSEEYDSEVDQPVRQTDQRVEVNIPPRDTAVLESDVSNGGSFASDDDEAPYEPWDSIYCSNFKAAEDRLAGNPKNVPNTNENPSASQSAAKENSTTIPRHVEMQLSMIAQSAKQPASRECDQYANTTDEESDYGDDISADLFDEDLEFDEHRRPERQPDTSSFSSQSPILSSLPSKIQLAAVAEPTKPVPSQSSSPALTRPLKTSQGSSSDAPRAPSPSDAAMAKGKVAAPYQFPLTPKNHFQDDTTTPATTSSAYSQFSVSHKPITCQPSGFMQSSSYSPNMSGPCVQDAYPQVYNGNNNMYGTDYWPAPQQSYYQSSLLAPPLDYAWGYSPIAPKTRDPVPKPLEPTLAPAPAPASSYVTLKATPRVAIRDLVDELETAKEPALAHQGPFASTFSNRGDRAYGTKRKADEISEDDKPALLRTPVPVIDDEIELAFSEEDAQIIHSIMPSTISHSQTDSLQPVDMTDDVASQDTIGEREERPKKKARSNFYKSAATAAGWIAVGAVGAVTALVALPQDFFV